MSDDSRFTSPGSEVPDSLRAHFVRHNLTALAFAVLTLIGAVFFWTVFYFGTYWITLLAASISQGVEAAAPAHFTIKFFAVAFTLCLVVAGIRWFAPHDDTVDRKPFWEILLDIVLVVPRMTFAIWGNLSACRPLSRRDMALAWQLLKKIVEAKSLSIHSVAVEIPDAGARAKIILALQLADLVYLKKTEDDFLLVPHGKEAQNLTAPRVRIKIDRQPAKKTLENEASAEESFHGEERETKVSEE